MQPRHARGSVRFLPHARPSNAIVAAIGILFVTGCGGGGSTTIVSPGNGTSTGDTITRPTFVQGTVNVKSYDGVSDDLATGGLGKDGLAGAAPVFANPTAPTAAELRRNAIYNNYRAIVDVSAAGGYGTLYGPNVDAQGNVTSGQGKVAGTEYIAFADDGSGQQNVTIMAQLPDTFDPKNPCIVSATSSGSRGVYGGIAVGEWGLKRGCAVAYTDKGTGAAPHDLDSDTVPLIDGTRMTTQAAGRLAEFVAPAGSTSLASFKAAYPSRLAFKHAHSKQNPEAAWGTNTLQAIEFTLYAINDKFGNKNASGVATTTFTRDNTIVIASAISNGGGAAIAAAELDTTGLIDGVAVGEPNVEMPPNAGVTVRRGGAVIAGTGKHLYDYTTTANLYQLCASQDTGLVNAPKIGTLPSQTIDRCASLANASKVVGGSTAAQAADALAKLHAAGWESESDELHTSLSLLEVASSISVTYANAYSRASVTDRLCSYSFASPAAGTLVPTPIPAISLAGLFATGNGIPPTTSVTIMNDDSPGGAMRDFLSKSKSSSVADANLDGVLCLRALFEQQNSALMTGIGQTYRNGNLRGKPAIIVHGRSDGLLPVNHTSRPYLGFNKSVEGTASKLSYIEVTNGQHFDGFIDLIPGYAKRFIPMHLYLNRALDAVYANLKNGTALPPSQVVRTTARGGNDTDVVGPQILPSNVPAISLSPAAGDVIAVSGSTVDVPN